jgi:hypothetical protein
MASALEKSREQYEREIEAAERLNTKKKEALDIQLRDSFLKETLSKNDFAQYQIGAEADRKTAAIDPRADNAAELARRYQAEKELALIQLRQTEEGFTQAISQDLNTFRAQYSDVIGSLPIEFEQIIPPVIAASGGMRDALTSDMGAISGATNTASQSFTLLGGNINATYDEIADGLRKADEAYKKAGFILHPDMGVMLLREQQTGGKLVGMTMAGGGMVEPRYLAVGGPAGTDTVPAMLTPGEGVLSRTGMAALDRLNSGFASVGSRGALHITIEKGAIDARGAQFADDRSLEVLADRVQAKLALLSQRNGLG